MRELVARTGLFSPPYGDGTKIGDIEHEMSSFSSPYGDGTDTRYQFKWNSEVFAPLRGWYKLSQHTCW